MENYGNKGVALFIHIQAEWLTSLETLGEHDAFQVVVALRDFVFSKESYPDIPKGFNKAQQIVFEGIVANIINNSGEECDYE